MHRITLTSAYLRYGSAVVSVLAALGLTHVLWALNPGIAPLFFVAVMFSTWYGGLGPGLVSTALAGFITAFYFAEPSFSLAIGFDDLLHLLVFLAEALVISYLANSSRASALRAEEAQREAEAASRAKDEFLSVLSHELRMPLNPVLTAASAMVRDATLPEQVREDMRMIQRNVQLEARLIDDLLDVSRLSKGKLHLEPALLDCHTLIRQVHEICRQDLEAKNLRFRVDAAAGNPFVYGDAARLQQIIWNLVRNATKFTPAGGSIIIRTRNALDPANPAGQLIIEVSDTGIGVEPAALGRIFNAFEQADSSIPQRFGGLGLGLAICRNLVALHGGSIGARSDGPDLGATFTVVLPAAAPVQQHIPAAEDGPRQARPKRILLVEDQQDTLRLMARLLRSANHVVDTADSVSAALDAASRADYDLVISDLGLPDGSGLELMRQLREQFNLRGIALTGYGTEDDIRSTREAGFSQHLTKPVDIDALENAIQRAH